MYIVKDNRTHVLPKLQYHIELHYYKLKTDIYIIV